MHRLGRICALTSALIMLGIPTVMSLIFGTFPGFGKILTASAGIMTIMIPLTVTEVLSYTPVLGSASYLTFITGNILNLKFPVATNALELANEEPGTEKGDVIATIAVSVSSMLTVLLIAVGALLLVPLKPILALPSIQTASRYIMPALFGALGMGILAPALGGGITSKGRLWGALVPTLLVIAAFFVLGDLAQQVEGLLILICLPITYLGSKMLYKKGIIKVIMPEDSPVDTMAAEQA